MSEMVSERLVICAGFRVRADCAEAIQSFATPCASPCRFMMYDWLPAEELRRAMLLWVVDESEPWQAVQFALNHYIPLLVPDASWPMKELCLRANCGIYYRDSAEAGACINFLLADEEIRKRMGVNGHGNFRQAER
jgi:hypothetical protein